MTTLATALTNWAQTEEIKPLADELRVAGHHSAAAELLAGDLPNDPVAASVKDKVRRLILEGDKGPAAALPALLSYLKTRAIARNPQPDLAEPLNGPAMPEGEAYFVATGITPCATKDAAMALMNDLAAQGVAFRLVRGVEVKVKTRVVEIEG